MRAGGYVRCVALHPEKEAALRCLTAGASGGKLPGPMKTALLSAAVAFTCIPGVFRASAEEGLASVYVVDKSAEFEGTGGACLPYTSSEMPGANREILAIAKAPADSSVFFFAVNRDAPHLGLAPVIAEQTKDSVAARFPGEGQTWAFDKPGTPVELYVAVFEKADPDLAKIAEYSEWLTEALGKNDEVEALLHTEAILKRLSNVLRQRRVEDYRVKYDESLSSVRVPPSSKAAITRGTTESAAKSGDRFPKASLAAVRRGLKTLDAEWKQDGRKIDYGPGQPGVLVFSITAPAPATLIP